MGNDTEEVRLELCSGLDVIHVLAGKRRCRQPAALPVDAFVVGHLPAMSHDGADLATLHLPDIEHDAAVVQEQDVASFNVARQLLVVETHTLLGAHAAVRA